MTLRLTTLCFDGNDPVRLARFWAGVLNWETHDEAGGWPLVWDQDGETAIRAPDGTGQFITFGPPLLPKTRKNRLHFDIAPPKDGDQEAEVERLISLGATRRDIGQGDVSWVVMADPDANEFCVLTPQ